MNRGRTARFEHPAPQNRFARQAVRLEFSGHQGQRGFGHRLSRIAGQVGQHAAGDRPAGPRPPAALFAARLIHAISQMLIMHARIAEKDAPRRVDEHPSQRAIGRRPVRRHRIPAGFHQVRAKSPVQTQESPGRAAAPP